MITQEDFGIVMDLLLAAYGDKAFPVNDKAKMNKTLHLWSVMFEDDSPEEILVAVKDCIATLQFPPRIADIKGRIAQNRMAGQPTEMEAWTMVYKTVMGCDSLKTARDLFDKLPRIAQELVGMPEQLMDWKEVDGNKLVTVVASNFMRSYKVKAEREASYHALPADMQKVESWKLPKPAEKPKELPKPEKTDYTGMTPDQVVGFEIPTYMVSTVKQWMDMGLPRADIRSKCINWGA